jgi:hypothetical protein
MQQLQADVLFPFRSATGFGNGPPLTIEGDAGLFSDGYIHLLLSPNVPATVRTNVGTVIEDGVKEYQVPGGVITFSNSDTASLQKEPTASNPEFTTLFAFDDTGNVVQVSMFYDRPTFTIRASRAFTGVVAYTPYLTTSRKLLYSPGQEPSPGGAITTFGVVAAYYQGSLAIHQVDATTLENGLFMPEFYRIYSEKVITPDGEFEFPPGYPSSGAYPAKAFTLDTSVSLKIERVHEMGQIDEAGRVFITRPNVLILEPYVGDTAYKPVTAKRIATLDPKVYGADIIRKANDFIASKGLGRE